MKKGKTKYLPPKVIIVPSCMACNSDVLPLVARNKVKKEIYSL